MKCYSCGKKAVEPFDYEKFRHAVDVLWDLTDLNTFTSIQKITFHESQE